MPRPATTPIGLALLACTAAPAAAQDPIRTFFGKEQYESFGWSVRSAGDVDNDGCDDLVVGVPSSDIDGTFIGWAEVLSGRDGEFLFGLIEGDSGDLYSYDAASGGDLDGDGFIDFLVGAQGEDTGGEDAGAVFVYSGQDGSSMYTRYGDGDEDWFSYSLNPCGDVNADGFPDFVVGAPEYVPFGQNGPGYARVFSGPDGSVIRDLVGDTDIDIQGLSVNGVGDLDGDGHAEVIVGAINAGQGGLFSGNLGRVRVYAGVDGSVMHEVWGESISGFGTSVDGAGDVTGDGVPDFVVGAPQISPPEGPGYVEVFSGRTGQLVQRHFGDEDGDWFGWSVSAAGDVDGDGRGDLVIGAPQGFGLETTSGYAEVYSGTTGQPIVRYDGTDSWTSFGYAVDGGGDVNGDGAPDPMIGSHGAHGELDYTGGVFVFSGNGPVRPFGEGCHGVEVDWIGAPKVGDGFELVVSGTPAHSLAYAVIGASDADFAGLTLPLDLAPLGAAGCSLLVSADALVPQPTGLGGEVAIPVAVPDVAALAGVTLFGQATVLDGGANAFGHTFSGGLELDVAP